MESAISVSNVHKKFKVYFDKGRSLKERLLFKGRRRFEERDVLNGISFEVGTGEAIGIIGENGSGKSTMLKLLTRIMYPDEGTLQIRGRVSALIELGAGFHPDMSGRENIYTNAAIFGLSRKEINARLQRIISFSELEEFIDNPVRTYSSGMYMRLAFSVAINVDADVLLIDEILAVGDTSFQAKCFNKLREIKANGTTIVIVSHSLGQIEQFCDRSLWLNHGIIEKSGNPFDVHRDYLEYMGNKLHEEPIAKPSIEDTVKSSEEKAHENVQEKPKNRWGSKEAEIITAKLLGINETEKYTFKTGDYMKITIAYRAKDGLHEPTAGVGIFRNDGIQCYGTNTFIDRISDITLKPAGEIHFVIEKNNLLEGEYHIDVALHTEDGFAYDYVKGAITFRIFSDLQDVGIARLEHTWRFR